MKSKTRRYHPNFVADLKNAIEFYDGMSSEIGNKLRDEIQSTIELIASTSEGFAIIHNNVRALRLKKFPYLILYRSFPGHVQFVGFVLGSSERQNWFDDIE